MILVVGATGTLGSEICKRLVERREKVRGLVRTTSSAEKVNFLRGCGVEICVGDLKDRASLAVACRDVDSVISTASSTLTRQEGDSIDSVDHAGQMHLVEAAKDAAISRFVFVSFRRSPGISSPLAIAKAEIENAIAGMNFTVVQASYFMEIWLSPALGFDYANATARIYGPGTSRVSWVSFRDVAEMCARVVRNPAAERRIIEFGGPEMLSPLDVVSRFEAIGGKPFKCEHVPVEALRAQFDAATDPMQKSFAGLMLSYAAGDSIDMTGIRAEFGISLTSVDQFARSVLGNVSAA